jgi:hypothetical protein
MRTVLHLLPALTFLSFAAAEPTPAVPPDRKQQEAVQKIQRMLDETLIESKHFPKDAPLADVLAALEKQLPEGKRIALRIDRDAFGDKAAVVAATPLHLPGRPAKTSLRRVLELAVAKIKSKADYRIGPAEVALTTPERAVYTVEYDIRDLVQKPEIKGAASLVQQLLPLVDPESGQTAAAQDESIEVLNGNRLLIRTNAAGQARIAEAIQALRRSADVLVIVNARLLEVDHAYYSKLQGRKRYTMENMEELERLFLDGKPQRLKGESPLPAPKELRFLLTGDEVKIDNGGQAGILSWQKATRLLPGPQQVRRGDKDRQVVLEGVSFRVHARVSSDRRYVWLKLTEKATTLQAVSRVKAWDAARQDFVAAEVPMLDETAYSRLDLCPDGGTYAVPVRYRPRSSQAKDRWWVLNITPRIYIEEEERLIRKAAGARP